MASPLASEWRFVDGFDFQILFATPEGLAPRSRSMSGHFADMSFTVNAADASWRGLFKHWKREFRSHHADAALRPKVKSGRGCRFLWLLSFVQAKEINSPWGEKEYYSVKIKFKFTEGTPANHTQLPTVLTLLLTVRPLESNVTLRIIFHSKQLNAIPETGMLYVGI